MFSRCTKLVVGGASLQRTALFHSTPCYLRRPRRRANVSNPGISYQSKNFRDEVESFENDPEGFGDLESDFLEVHKTHRQHEQELFKKREYVRHQMVKHKYFREPKMPNLLFYGEKEQIRLLHAQDPEEWSAEKLAESFPATPQIITKILAANWRPYSLKRLKKHDETVLQNWELLKAGRDFESGVKIPEEVRQHFLRFSDRKDANVIPTEAAVKLLRPKLPIPKSTEFISIITSVDRSTKKEQKDVEVLGDHNRIQNTKEPGKQLIEELASDPYFLGKGGNARQIRFEEFKKTKIGSYLNELSSSSSEENAKQEPIHSKVFENPDGTGIKSSMSPAPNRMPLVNFSEKFQSNEIVISVEDQKRFEMTSVKDRIHIPRKVYRKGATYRVDDCYYDDDGELLYRVPGMVGAKRSE